ncbi:MAG TPA: OsmC family protein [Segetibacter sp.]|nr:OsmC family protein [Segetibacter sp.]
MLTNHHYALQLHWTGNTGQGTTTYRSYKRDHQVCIEGKPVLECSSDVAFRGDKTKYTPEELLLASLSSCHMLWYLHLAANAGVIVVDYRDLPKGTMVETDDGDGQFTEVTLHPQVTVAGDEMLNKANELHRKANELCFIARSVNFPVYHQPSCSVKSSS